MIFTFIKNKKYKGENMKKLLSLVIAAGLCAGLCGCASTMKIDADVHLIPSITDGSEPDAGLPG